MHHQRNGDMSTGGAISEADYLRQMIEKQPAVLMRARVNGELLAANDAALGLLGAEHLDQLAGLALPSCVAPEHRSRWSEFSAAIESGTRNSFECDFTNLVGTCRTILFHGVPLMDNQDGIPSVILSAHDMSSVRWSEGVFENTNSTGRPPVEPPALETQQGRLEQLERLLRDGRNHLLELRTTLERAHAEARSLTAQLADREALLQRAAAALAELEHSAAESTRERLQTERLAQEQVTKLAAERDQLTEFLHARERELQGAAEKQELFEERLQTVLSEHARLETLLNDRAGELETVKAARESVTKERDVLHDRLETAENDRLGLRAQLEAATTARLQAEELQADERLELDRVHAGTKQLLPLVSAGRLALEISGDLTGLLVAIDARVASLLAKSPRDSSARSDLQLLSSDVFTATLLSREILLSSDGGSVRSALAGVTDDTTR